MIKGSLEEVRKQINKAKGKVIVLGGGDDFNRKILEMKKVDVLLSPEYKHERDMLKQRDSGLNHIMCKFARKNNVVIGIDFNNLKEKNKIKLAKWLARVMQNIKLCRKAGVKMQVFNCEMDKQALRAFLLSLGMSTQQAKQTIELSI